MSWNNILTGNVVVWQQIPTLQVPRWGIRILKWENNSSVVLGWANNTGTQLNWGSNPGNLPRTETSAFWADVPT